MENPHICYHGFSPSEFTRRFLGDEMSALLDIAPYRSTLRANFTRQDGLLKGIVTINSSAGQFRAVAKGDRLKELTDKLTDQIRKRLDRWKSQRFTRPKWKIPRMVDHDSDSVA